MTSYCTVCRGLFELPDPHQPDSGNTATNATRSNNHNSTDDRDRHHHDHHHHHHHHPLLPGMQSHRQRPSRDTNSGRRRAASASGAIGVGRRGLSSSSSNIKRRRNSNSMNEGVSGGDGGGATSFAAGTFVSKQRAASARPIRYEPSSTTSKSNNTNDANRESGSRPGRSQDGYDNRRSDSNGREENEGKGGHPRSHRSPSHSRGISARANPTTGGGGGGHNSNNGGDSVAPPDVLHDILDRMRGAVREQRKLEERRRKSSPAAADHTAYNNSRGTTRASGAAARASSPSTAAAAVAPPAASSSSSRHKYPRMAAAMGRPYDHHHYPHPNGDDSPGSTDEPTNTTDATAAATEDCYASYDYLQGGGNTRRRQQRHRRGNASSDDVYSDNDNHHDDGDGDGDGDDDNGMNRVHPHSDGVDGGRVGDGSGVTMLYRQLSLKQQSISNDHRRRLESLRGAFVDLCAAVRDDLHAMEERLDGKIHSESSRLIQETSGFVKKYHKKQQQQRQKEKQDRSYFTTASSDPLHNTNSSNTNVSSSLSPVAIAAALRAATQEERRLVAEAIAPELHDVIAAQVAAAMDSKMYTTANQQHQLWQQQQQQQSDALQEELHSALSEHSARMEAKWRRDIEQRSSFIAVGGSPSGLTNSSNNHGGLSYLPIESSSLLAEILSSPEAFDAHVRSAARAVLAEEDTYRYQTAAHAVRQEQEQFQRRLVSLTDQRLLTALGTMQVQLRDEVLAVLVRERSRSAAPLERRVADLAGVVDALTRDLTRLSRQQDTLTQAVATTTTTNNINGNSGGGGLSVRHGRGSRDAPPPPLQQQQRQQSLFPSPEQYASADSIRTEVIQPALDHLKRLLSAHQKLVDTVVEQRCQRAEQAAVDGRHIWDANVAELRSKVGSLRLDVRGALAELCQNLNVAAPGL